jgi:hypothetical protein
VVLAAGNAWADPPAKPGSVSDSLSGYRARFQLGMSEYQAGAVANAIADWEPVYIALGSREGYRVAYDLGVAYVQVGDGTLAAERLQSFLDEVTMRRESGEAVSALVTREETDARARLAELVETKGRIRIDASPGLRAQIDQASPRSAGFVAWVTPGQHTVTFSATFSGALSAALPTSSDGTSSDVRIVDVQAGELVDVAPSPSLPTASLAAPPVPEATAAPAPAPPLQEDVPGSAAPEALAPAIRPLPIETRTRHPVSPPFILTSGALTAVAVAVAVPLGIHAFSLHSRFVDEKTSTGAISASDRENFDETRTAYDVALGSAIAFGVLTTALTTWYFAGSSREYIPIEPVIAHERGGASVAVKARF